MPALGDPPPATAWESRTAHGAVAAVAYVPSDPAQALEQRVPGSRTGGRRFEEMRTCHLRVGAVPNAAGSAYIEQGKTKIIAAVYGPRQVIDQRQASADGVLNVELQFSSFSTARASKEENEKRAVLYGSILKNSLRSVVLLDRYGKTVFDISLMVLEDDGSVLSSALSVASLALADAMVEMRDLAAGATVQLSRAVGAEQGQLMLDCDGDEEHSLPEGSAVVHLGFCPGRGVVCLLHSAGPLPPGPFEQMVLLAKDTAEAVGAEIRRVLEKRVERRAVKRLRLTAEADAAGGGDMDGSLAATAA